MCSTQLKVMAPSSLVSLKRSRNVPFSLSRKSSFAFFLLTHPTIMLQPSVSKKLYLKRILFAINYLCVKQKKKWRKDFFSKLKLLPFLPKVHQVLFDQLQNVINPKPASLVLLHTHTCARTHFISWRLRSALWDTQLQTRTLTLENLDQWTSSSGPSVRNGQFSFSNWNFQVCRINW